MYGNIWIFGKNFIYICVCPVKPLVVNTYWEHNFTQFPVPLYLLPWGKTPEIYLNTPLMCVHIYYFY